MGKTKIEWALNPDGTQGYTLSDKTGCLNGCEYCYARRLANTRLKERYLANINVAPIELSNHPSKMAEYSNRKRLLQTLDPFYPRFWPERLEQIRARKKPAGIFLNDMSDWMGDYWPDEWTEMELKVMRDCPQHRFYTLTKQPQNLPAWSPFPDNAWVGVTATDGIFYREAIHHLFKIEAKIKFVSFEPLLQPVGVTDLSIGALDWVIIGSLTGTYQKLIEDAHKYPDLTLTKSEGTKWTLQPKIEWVNEIIEACDKAQIPVFLKDNLKPIMVDEVKYPVSKTGILRQELPNV